jgi:hypothetical protein
MTMEPPHFASAQPDGTPMQFMHRARQFRRAAMPPMPDYESAGPFWPKYALLTHAIELALKAFVAKSATAGIPAGKEPKQHDLLGWYQLAVVYGLAHDPRIEENVDYLSELHRIHYMRYPQRSSKPVPNLSVIADETADRLLDQIMPVTNPR